MDYEINHIDETYISRLGIIYPTFFGGRHISNSLDNNIARGGDPTISLNL